MTVSPSRRLWSGVCVAGLVGLSLAWIVQAEEATTRRTRSTSKTSESSSAADDVKVIRKLDQILKNQETMLQNQQEILGRFDAVMEELRIVKVRALINN